MRPNSCISGMLSKHLFENVQRNAQITFLRGSHQDRVPYFEYKLLSSCISLHLSLLNFICPFVSQSFCFIQRGASCVSRVAFLYQLPSYLRAGLYSWVIEPKITVVLAGKNSQRKRYAKFSVSSIQKLGNSRINNPSYHGMTQCFTSHLPLQCTLAIVYSPHSTLSIEVF